MVSLHKTTFLQRGYPGNAPFPLCFGIPNAQPLSYEASSTLMELPRNNTTDYYYHSKPPKNFEFTQNNPRLNLKQRQFYEENGFLVIPKLVPEDLLDHCAQRFLDIVDGKVPKGTKQTIFKSQ